MIHEAYMPVYMGSRFLARDGRGPSKVVQEVLADLKILFFQGQLKTSNMFYS